MPRRGYHVALHTVPAAVHAWLRHGDDYRAAIVDVIRCGGDADTTAAIAGGIVGAGVGRAGIPDAWIEGLCEWTRSVEWMTALGRDLARVAGDSVPRRPPSLAWPAIVARNVVFLAVVLAHGFRRALPPY